MIQLVPKEVSAKRLKTPRRDNTMGREDNFAKRQPRRKAFRISDIILMSRLRGSGVLQGRIEPDDDEPQCLGFF